MRILLHADSLIRDAAPMLVLAELLKKRGHRVIVSSRPTTHFYVKFWRPHYLVHTNPATVGSMWDKGLITPEGPIVGIIPQEGMERQEETMHAFYKNILKPGIQECIDQVFMWNSYQRDWILKACSLEKCQVSVVGNVRMDLAKFGAKERSRRGYVGFVGRFPTLNKYDGSQDFMKRLMSEQGARSDRFLRNRTNDTLKQVATVIAYGDIIHRLMRETDYKVSLRPHHEEASFNECFTMLKAKYGDRFEIDRSLSIYDWSMSVDTIISTTSNTFVEAYLAKTPVICIDHLTASAGGIDEDEIPILESYDQELLPKDSHELFETLDKCMRKEIGVRRNQKLEALMAEAFSWPYAGSALLKIVDHINNGNRNSPDAPTIIYELLGDLVYLSNSILVLNSLKRSVDKHYTRIARQPIGFVKRIVDSIMRLDERVTIADDGCQ